MLAKLWGRSWSRNGGRIDSLEELFAGHQTGAPSHQNAIDLIPGWQCHFPTNAKVRAGILPAFEDPRIAWAIESYGDLRGRTVLELGPLEAAHTWMLARAGAQVDAIESNQLAYFKCLITKEILGFPNARFFLGDFVAGLEQNEKRYDFIVASGVLYHMRDPLRLLQAMADRTDVIYLWTVMVNNDKIRPSGRRMFNGVDVRLYSMPYGRRDVAFCGGPSDRPNWMYRDDILAVLKSLGFTDLSIAHDLQANPGNALPTFSVFARRPPAPRAEHA
jgi:hypothetical protein